MPESLVDKLTLLIGTLLILRLAMPYSLVDKLTLVIGTHFIFKLGSCFLSIINF